MDPVRETALPTEASTAIDLRLDESGQPLLAVAGQGSVLLSWPLSQEMRSRVLTRDPGIRFVAVSEHYWVAASVFYQIRWQGRDHTADSGSLGLEFIEGVDVHGDRLALLGLQRYEDGMSRDGAIAWTAGLAGAPFSVEPLAYAAAGPGARPFDQCVVFGIGGIRFLPDGRLVLVPGAEPGVFLYGSDQGLVKSWDTDALAIGADCTFGEEQAAIFRTDEDARMRYLNRFRIVDEILPFSFGPGLIVRNPRVDGPRWDLVLLEASGDATLTLPIPVEATSDFARLRGDARGREITLLYSEVIPGLGSTAGRIVELRLEGPVFGSGSPTSEPAPTP